MENWFELMESLPALMQETNAARQQDQEFFSEFYLTTKASCLHLLPFSPDSEFQMLVNELLFLLSENRGLRKMHG